MTDYTKEQIALMIPGPELNELVGIHITKVEPRTEYWAIDREEKGIFITFDYKSEADTWLKGQSERFPQWVEREGCHIVEKKIYPRYSEDISASWQAEEAIFGQDSELQEEYAIQLHNVLGLWLHEPTTLKNIYQFAHASPLERCKAALLAISKGRNSL
jgi:hypothetical protein